MYGITVSTSPAHGPRPRRRPIIEYCTGCKRAQWSGSPYLPAVANQTDSIDGPSLPPCKVDAHARGRLTMYYEVDFWRHSHHRISEFRGRQFRQLQLGRKQTVIVGQTHSQVFCRPPQSSITSYIGQHSRPFRAVTDERRHRDSCYQECIVADPDFLFLPYQCRDFMRKTLGIIKFSGRCCGADLHKGKKEG